MNMNHRATLLAIVAGTGLAAVVMAGCGDPARMARAPATPAPCPTIVVGAQTNDDEHVAVLGAFSEACAQGKVNWPFKLPALAATHEPPVFRIPERADLTDLDAMYKPIGNAPSVRIEIHHDYPAYGGQRREETLSGVEVYFELVEGDGTPTERSAYWTQSRVTYLLIATQTNMSIRALDDFLTSVAKTMIEDTAAR